MVTDSWRTQTDRRWEYKTANRCQSTRLPTWSFLLTLRREWWTCTPVKPMACVGGINFSRLLANFPRKISKRNIRNNCCHEKHGLFTNGYPYRFLSLEFHLIFSLADRSLFWTMRLVIFLQSSVWIRQESWILGLRLLMNTWQTESLLCSPHWDLMKILPPMLETGWRKIPISALCIVYQKMVYITFSLLQWNMKVKIKLSVLKVCCWRAFPIFAVHRFSAPNWNRQL